MADDNNSRYRSNDPFGRGPAPTGPANDPLAELARLIGQSDPFAEFGARAARAGAARRRRAAMPQRYAPSDRAPRHRHDSRRPRYARAAPRYRSGTARLRALPHDDPAADAPRIGRRRRSSRRRASRDHAIRRGRRAALRRRSACADDWPGGAARARPIRRRSVRIAVAASGRAAPTMPRALAIAIPSPLWTVIQPDRSGFDPAGYQPEPEPPPFAQPLYPHEPDGRPDAAAARRRILRRRSAQRPAQGLADRGGGARACRDRHRRRVRLSQLFRRQRRPRRRRR